MIPKVVSEDIQEIIEMILLFLGSSYLSINKLKTIKRSIEFIVRSEIVICYPSTQTMYPHNRDPWEYKFLILPFIYDH